MKNIIKFKKMFYLMLSLIVYMFCLTVIYNMPKMIYAILIKIGLGENSNIFSIIITTTIVFALSSKVIFEKIIKAFNKIENKSTLLFSFIVPLKSLLNVVYVFPTRTIIFIYYLVFTVASKIGFNNIGDDYLFAAVYIIGLDRIISNWEKDKVKLHEYGNEVYSN